MGPGVDPRRVSLKYSVAHNLEAIANCLGKPVRWGGGRGWGSQRWEGGPAGARSAQRGAALGSLETARASVGVCEARPQARAQ